MTSSWKEQVLKSFDTAAPDYEAHSDIQKQTAQELINLCPEHAESVLEIGCGTGSLTRHLLERYPQAQLDITDISPAMLDAARQSVDVEHVNWKVMDGENPNLNQTYDLIIANMAFQWFEDLPAALERLKTHLNPGGQILYSMPGSESFYEWRSVLAELSFESGVLPFRSAADLIKEEEHSVKYPGALEFLRSIKKIGAQKAKPDYVPLSPAQLRRACTLFDKRFDGEVTWHILYESVQKGT